MPDPLNPRLSQQGAALSRRLGSLTIPLFLTFFAVVLSGILPLQMLDPLWQQRFCSLLVDNGAFPLMGMAFLHLASYLDPGNGRLAARLRSLASWATLAALGYLLLMPLQPYSAWRTYTSADQSQRGQLSAANKRFADMRQAILSSPNPSELQNRLQALQGPLLGPADLAIPLPALRERLLSSLHQAEQRVGDRLQGPSKAGLWNMVQGSLRVVLTAAGYTIGFAALAQRRGKDVSLLQEARRALPPASLKNLLPAGRKNDPASGERQRRSPWQR
jgi:hypothetical protein